MNKPPAFQFYPKDFLADINVSIMSMEERGVYITLLSHLWLEGKLPNDERVLKRLCSYPHNKNERWADIWAVVGCCFRVKRGHLSHKRLDEEREKQNEWREKCSLGGQIGAQKRWGTTPDKNKGSYKGAITRPQVKDSSSSSSSSTNTKNKNKDTCPKRNFSDTHLKLAELLESGIKERLPRHPLAGSYLETWANTFRIMEEKDQAKIGEIEQLIIWIFNHDFWYKNILSADKLRKQFGRLWEEMGEPPKGPQPDRVGKQQPTPRKYTDAEKDLLPDLKEEYAEKLEEAKERHGWKTDDDIDPFKVPSESEYINARLKELKGAKKRGTVKCPSCRAIVLNGEACGNCGEALG